MKYLALMDWLDRLAGWVIQAVVLCAIFLLLLMMLRPAMADSDCIVWAQLVTEIEKMQPEEVTKQSKVWLAYAGSNKLTKRYILNAVNWVNQGETSEEAWKECGSY